MVKYISKIVEYVKILLSTIYYYISLDFIEDKLIEKDRRKCEELAYRVLSGEISIFLERSGNVSKIERSVNGDEI